MQQMYAMEQMQALQRQQDEEAYRIQQQKDEALAEKVAYRKRLAAERKAKVAERRLAAKSKTTTVASTVGAKTRSAAK
jgi:hypothetical protein